jgi:hypothetical protein
MKRKTLGTISGTELVERFLEIALEQDNAILMDEIARYNRLYGRMEEVKEELKRRPGDLRRALVALYDHPNAQVRLKAAIATLAVEPESARSVLQGISDRNEYPQAADARGMMRALDEGAYKPT